MLDNVLNSYNVSLLSISYREKKQYCAWLGPAQADIMLSMPEVQRLIAIDPSLTCSGWALFGVRGAALLAVGKIRSLSPKLSMSERLADVQRKVTNLFDQFKLGSGDVLICEAQTTMRDPKAAFKVEYVRGIFESIGRERELEVPGRLNPRTVQREIMGLSGQQVERSIIKETAVRLVDRLYGPALMAMGLYDRVEVLHRHQDIVDAVLLGALGVSRVEHATRAGCDLHVAFAPRNERMTRRLAR